MTWFVAAQAGLTISELQAVDVAGWELRWGLIALSALMLLGGYFATGFLWGHVAQGLGAPSLPVFVSIRLFMIANLGRYIPGKIWQIAGLAALARQEGVGAVPATASAVLGQGIGLASATLVGLGAVWTLADGAAWRWAVPAFLMGSMVVGLTPPVFRGVSGLWFRLAKTEQPEDLTPRLAAGWLVIGLATWIVYAASFWVLVLGLGFDAGPLPTASAFAAAYVLGYVMVFAPAGIGVREGFLVALLSPQLGAAVAGAVAVIARLWTTVVEVVPAATFWVRHITTVGASASGE